MKSAILDKGESFYTYLGKIFQAIENEQMKYNWLISYCEGYSHDENLNKLLMEEYAWISGEKLTDYICKEDFQFIWGVISGFPKDITLEEILKYELPFADGNKEFWVDDVKIQHPLADIEIVAWDSTCTLFLSKHDELVKKFRCYFPLSEDLSARNIKQNAEIANIQELLIKVLVKRNLDVNEETLYKKYLIWRNLYSKDTTNKVKEKDIIKCIKEMLNK